MLDKEVTIMYNQLSIFLLILVLLFTYTFSFRVNNISIMRTRSGVRASNNKILVNKLNSQSTDVIPGVGVEGCKIESPSKINILPEPVQAVVFALVSLGLYGGTVALLNLISFAENVAPGIMSSWESSWFVLGFFFMLAGAAHFTVKKDFVNIYPSRGSWGFWYLPGSAEFHVEWTGVAELVGGFWLLLGGISNLGLFTLPSVLGNVMQDGATALLLLTIAVTPANIYMLSHGAKLPIDGPQVPINFHFIRLAIQCLLFSMFYKISIM